jgi:(5-formylfuran-3-yl)methyl phosphate synthase
MVKLLISVKDVNEAKLAYEAGADFIDLKNPEKGALGHLCNTTTAEIVNILPSNVTISATVGDTFENVKQLVTLLEDKAKLGVKILKLPVFDCLINEKLKCHFSAIKQQYQVEFIAVFNACEAIDLTKIKSLKSMGFYGAMLDTFDKSQTLIQTQTNHAITQFIQQCHQHNLVSGLAGALKSEMVDNLVTFNPNYLGFRSGVCAENMRKNKLLPEKVKFIKNKLYKHNILSHSPIIA